MPGQTKRQASRVAAWATNSQGVLECHWNNWKCVRKIKFPHVKGFLQKSSTILANALKKVYQTCPMPTKFQSISMKKCHIINLSGAPTCLGPALYVAYSTGELYVLNWVMLFTRTIILYILTRKIYLTMQFTRHLDPQVLHDQLK
jgi:ABC-type siderophore export system fused ATPase/permease subunit